MIEPATMFTAVGTILAIGIVVGIAFVILKLFGG